MLTARDFWSLDRRALADRLNSGHHIDPHALDEKVYRGTSLGLPAIADRLLWKTFQKAFHRDGEVLRGWNVRLEQDGVEAKSRPMRRRTGEARTFGHFLVRDVPGEAIPGGRCAGLLLDYGRGGQSALDPVSHLCDPIVAVEPGRTDLLLGWTFVKIGRLQVGTPSFFTLELDGPLEGPIPLPPRR